MSLRIECSTFGLCTPQRAVGTNKFVIPKILIENLIDDGFSVKEMSNILCVSERTVLRRMVEYGLTQRAVGTNKFVIPKILIENLIDDGFSVKEMSNILCVSERTVLRHMVVWLNNQEFFRYF